MEINFQKSKLSCLRPLLREVKNQEQTQEIRLSDGMPDIGRVISAWGQPILRSKEWRSDEIAASGGVMAWVLYAPEDGSAPKCLESWIPIQMKWDLPEGSREGTIRIRSRLRFLDARTVSARKIMLRTGIAAMGEAFAEDEMQLGMPGEVPEDVELLTVSYPLRLPVEAGEKSFLLDEDLTLPGSCPMPEKIIYAALEPRVMEQRVMSNKVVFRGNGNLHILYDSDEGQLQSWDFELPFSQLGDLQGMYTADAQPDVQVEATSLEVELDDESHVRLKCGLLGQYLVSDRMMAEMVEDAYSPLRDVKQQRESLTLPVMLEQRQETLRPEQTIPKEAQRVVDNQFLPDFPRQRRNGDTVRMEIPGQFQVLYIAEDGALQSAASRWEGEHPIEAGEGSRVEATAALDGRPQAMAGGSIQTNAALELTIESWAEQEMSPVTGLELAQPRAADPDRPSVILRRAGEERLWDIAKDTGSTMAAIRAANALEGEPAENQVLLIPVS